MILYDYKINFQVVLNWKFYMKKGEIILKNIKTCQRCKIDFIEYNYGGEEMCGNCLLRILERNSEVHLSTFCTTSYYVNGRIS